MIDVKTNKQEENHILIIADNFTDEDSPVANPIRLTDSFGVDRLIDLVLHWTSRLPHAHVYIASTKLSVNVAERIVNKWKYYMNVKVLHMEGCSSFGDVMRQIDQQHLINKEFILIDGVPLFHSSHLVSSLAEFEKLRKKDKNNVITMLCTPGAKCRFPYVLESGTNRLITYNSAYEDVSIKLNKKDFAAGRIVRSDLQPSGIYMCAPDIIARFTDEFDTKNMDELLRYILAHEDVLLQEIHVDVAPNYVSAECAHYCAAVARSPERTPFSPPNPSIIAAAKSNARNRLSSHSDGSRQRQVSYKDEASRDTSPDPEASVWPAHVDSATLLTKPATSPRLRRRSRGSVTTSLTSISKSTKQNMDVVLDINFKGRDQFDEEIIESMRTCLEAEEWDSREQQNKLIVEINSSKISYNIALEHLAKAVFYSFMQQEKFGPTLVDMRKFVTSWSMLWQKWYKTAENQIQLLNAIEEHAAKTLDWVKFAPKFIMFLYDDAEILTDISIIEWWEKLDDKHVLKNDALTQLVDWVKEPEDSDDNETEGSDA